MLSNEMKKFSYKYWLMGFLIISVFLNILQLNVTTGYTIENWRSGALAEKELAYEMLEQDLEEEVTDAWISIIEEIDYCLNNDIPYNVMNMVSYATSMSGMDTFLYLVLIIATSMIIYVEDKSNTWKNLITTPKVKKQLLATKMGIAFISILSMILVFALVSLLFGFVKYGCPTNSSEFIYINGVGASKNIYMLFSLTLVTIVLKASVWCGLLFAILALKQNSDVTGITVTILLIMCCEMVADIVPKPLSNILPFSYLAKATSVAIETMMPMVIVLSCYSIILWGIYLMKFKRQL